MGLWMWFSRPKRALQHLKVSPALVVGAVLYSIIAPLFGASLVLFTFSADDEVTVCLWLSVYIFESSVKIG